MNSYKKDPKNQINSSEMGAKTLRKPWKKIHKKVVETGEGTTIT